MTNTTQPTARASEAVDLVIGFGAGHVTFFLLRDGGDLSPLMPFPTPQGRSAARFARTVDGYLRHFGPRGVLVVPIGFDVDVDVYDTVLASLRTVSKGHNLPVIELPRLEVLAAHLCKEGEELNSDDV